MTATVIMVAIGIGSALVSMVLAAFGLASRGMFYTPPQMRQVKHRWFAWHPVYADLDARGYRWVWWRVLIRQAHCQTMEWRYEYWTYTRHPPWNHNPNRNP